jgi:hypothetical protein
MEDRSIIIFSIPIYSTPAPAVYIVNNMRLLKPRKSKMAIRIVELGADKNK